MEDNREYLEILLRKYRGGTMSREEFEELKAYMERPGAEQEIKRYMDKHWKEIEAYREEDGADEEYDPDMEDDPDEEDDSPNNKFSLN